MLLKKICAYFLCFVLPLSSLVYGVFSGFFSAEFSTEVMHWCGRFAIILLVLMLFANPLSRILPPLKRHKKELGISAFLFAALHFLLFALGSDLGEILREITKRRYILLGFLPLCLLFFMFIFSFIFRRFFKKLAALTLPFTLLAALHYLFSGKTLSFVALGIFALLFALVCARIRPKDSPKGFTQ